MMNVWIMAEGKTDLKCLRSIFQELFCDIDESYDDTNKTAKFMLTNSSKIIWVHLYSEDKPGLRARWQQRYREFDRQHYEFRYMKDTDDPKILSKEEVTAYQRRISQRTGIDSSRIVPVQPEIEAWFLAAFINFLIQGDYHAVIDDSCYSRFQKVSNGFQSTENVDKETLARNSLQTGEVIRLTVEHGCWTGSEPFNKTLGVLLPFLDRLNR